MSTLKIKNGTVWEPIVAIKGEKGEKGDAGDALPAGGVAGQLLIKNSATDNDATWQNNPSAPLSHTHTIANVTGLQSALDGKVDDSQVLTNVPAGAVFTDTIYIHPASHPASIITQDTDNRFVTDAEKVGWNGKALKPTNESTATNGQILTANGDGTSTYKNLLMPKNWIINGMFDVWQRGTTQITTGYGSDDRWSNNVAGATQTVSRQSFAIGQTSVPNNPTYFSRTVVVDGAVAGSTVEKIHKIEDVTKFSGKTITYSFWAKADANKNIAVEIYRYYGSGGSGYDLGLSVQKFALTTSWQRFTKTVTLPSVSGKTIGANNCTHFSFWFDAGSNYASRTDSLGNQSGTFDIANVSLVEGSFAVECQNQPYADVLRECQRYYQRFGGNSVYEYLAQGIVSHTTFGRFLIKLNGKMRSLPQLEYATLLIVQPASSNLAVLSAVMDMAGTDTCTINATCAGGLTLSQPVYLTTNNNLSGYIAFHAEL